MTTKIDRPRGARGLPRREALKTLGGVSALAAGALATSHWKRAYAQSKKVVRVWTTQVAPDQLKANELYKKTFEEAHPGIELAWGSMSPTTTRGPSSPRRSRAAIRRWSSSI